MRFLSFEGIDSSGKSTLKRGLEGHLKVLSVPFLSTREPGGTPLAEKIRRLLLEETEDVPVPRAELLLYEASRAQNVDKLIKPALLEKKWVLCDRFTASSVAFQAGGRGLSQGMVEDLNRYAVEDCTPDLFVLVDISVEESQKRRQGQKQDRFEKEAASFHDAVRNNYLKQSKSDPKRWLVLDGSKPQDILLNELIKDLKQRQWLQSSDTTSKKSICGGL